MKMSKKTVPPILAVILAVIAGVFWFSPNPDKQVQEQYTVSSENGAVTLSIPLNALPENVDKNEISILPSTLTTVEGNEEEGAVSYQLNPDGLEFSKPVTISLNEHLTETDEGEYLIPIMMHRRIVDGVLQTEIVDDTTVVIDTEEKKF